jgi:hypothetical protein
MANVRQDFAQSFRKHYSAALNSDQNQFLSVFVSFDYLVSNASERPLNGGRVQDDCR